MFQPFHIYSNNHRHATASDGAQLRIHRGTTPTWRMLLRDAAARAPIDLTDLTTVEANLCDAIKDSPIVYESVTPSHTVIDATGGVVDVSLTSDQTALYPNVFERLAMELVFYIDGVDYRFWLDALIVPTFLDKVPEKWVFTGTVTETVVSPSSGGGDPLDPPAAPTTLGASSSNGVVSLSWTDNSDNEDGFKIERSLDGLTGWTQIDTTGSGATTYADDTGTVGVTYYYRVRAFNGDGDSDYSNVDSATVADTAPSAPSDLDATADAETGHVTLTWTDTSDNETGFRVYRKTVIAGTWTLIHTTAADATSYIDTTVPVSDSYNYRIAGVNAIGEGPTSSWATVAVTVPVPIPDDPTDLSVTFNVNQMELSWTDNADNETGFKIERSTNGGAYSQIDTVAANETTYNDTAVNDGTQYNYRVRAYNDGGNSGYSNVDGDTWPLPAPSDLTATYDNVDIIDLSWTDNSGSEELFRIERKVGAGAWIEIATQPILTTYADTAISEGNTYTYRVRAYNTAMTSDYSNEASDTVLTLPEGLVFYWKANADGGASYLDETGDHTLTDANTTFQSGEGNGGAYELTAGSESTVTCPHADVLAVRPDEDFTLEFRFKISDSTSNRIDISKNVNNGYYSLGFRPSSGMFARLVTDSGIAIFGQSVAQAYTLGDWAHLAMVVDRATDECRFYFNGVLLHTISSFDNLNTFGGEGVLGIGYRLSFPQLAYDYATALVEEVRIWNTARTAQELLDNKDSELF